MFFYSLWVTGDVNYKYLNLERAHFDFYLKGEIRWSEIVATPLLISICQHR